MRSSHPPLSPARRRWLLSAAGAAATLAAPPLIGQTPLSRPLRVVMDARAAPVSFVGPDGQPRGFAVDLLRRLAGPARLNIESLLPMPAADAFSAFAARSADLVLAASRSDERARHALFTRPYHSLSTVLVSRLMGRHYQSLEQGRGARLAVPADHALLSHLRQRFPDITPVPVASPVEVLQAVARQRADAGVVAGELVMQALQGEPGHELAITGLLPEAGIELSFMLQPDLAPARLALDEALAGLSEDWLRGLRERWFGLPAGERGSGLFGWPQLLGLAYPALLLGGGAVLGSGAWIYWLRREIRRRREAERSMARSLDAQALAAGNRKRFIGFISHEARTLVATMVGGLELMAQHNDPGLRQRIVDGLRANASGLKQLLDESLDAAAIDAGAVRVRPRAVRVACVMAQLRGEAAALAAAKQLELVVDIHGARELYALADPVRLAQALRNLVFNALKFTHRGGVCISAALHHVDGVPQVAIEVADSGPGIEAADVERLFQPFSQLEQSQPAHPGSGLGLAISRELVQRMQGRLTVRSRPGQGSVFVIELPAVEGARPAGAIATLAVI